MKKKLLALLLSVSMLATEAGYADISVLAASKTTDEYTVESAGEGLAITADEADVSVHEATLKIASQGEGTYTFQQAMSKGEATLADIEFKDIAAARIVSEGEGLKVLTAQEGLAKLTLNEKDDVLSYVADELEMNRTYYFKAKVQKGQKIFESLATVKTLKSKELEDLLKKLAATILRALAADKDQYTAEQLASLKSAISAGEALQDQEGDIIKEVSEAEATLAKAIETTKGEGSETGDVNTKDLDAAITAAEKAIEGKTVNDFATSDWDDFAKAIADAKAVRAKADLTQNEVDEATAKLDEATNALTPLAADAATAKADLADAIAAAKEAVKASAPEEAKTAYNTAIEAAQKKYDEDTKDSDKAYYEGAKNDLETAGTTFANAVKAEAKKALTDLIAVAKGLLETPDALASSKAALKTAIEAAEQVAKAETSTVDAYAEAVKTLQAAIDKFKSEIPVKAIEATATAEKTGISVEFTGVNDAASYTISRATVADGVVGEYSEIAKDVAIADLTTVNAADSLYKEDFSNGAGIWTTWADGEKEAKEGKAAIDESGYYYRGAGNGRAENATLPDAVKNNEKDILFTCDLRLEASGISSQGRTYCPALVLTENKLNSNGIAFNEAYNDAIFSIAVKGSNDAAGVMEGVIINNQELPETELEKWVVSGGGKAGGSNQNTGWLHVVLKISYTDKKVNALIVRGGEVIYSNTLDFINPDIKLGTIHLAGGRDVGYGCIDNISIATASKYVYTDNYADDAANGTTYSYQVSTAVDGTNYISNAAEATVNRNAADKTALKAAIAAAAEYKEDDYTAESWADFAKALADANTINADANATQEQVDGAVAALNTAITKLVKKGEEPPVVENKPKKGDTFKVGKVTYKVLTASTVTYVSSTDKSKKNAAITIDAKVKTPKGKYDKEYSMKITEISKNAFKSGKIKSVKIGKYVTKIGESAFASCDNLTTVTMGASVKTIGKNAFLNDKNLKDVKGTNTKLETIGATAFKGCKVLKTVLNKNTLPNTLKKIDKGAFQGCAKLTKIVIGKDSKSVLTTIGANAFNGAKKLKTIKITSKKLKKGAIGKNAFKGITVKSTISYNNKIKKATAKKIFTTKAGVKGKVKAKAVKIK